MSFWENNKDTFKAAGAAGLKGAAIGGKKLAKVSYSAGKTAYNNRDKTKRTAHGQKNRRRNNRDESEDEEEEYESQRSSTRPLSTLSNPNLYGPPPSRHAGAVPVAPSQDYYYQQQQQQLQYPQQPPVQYLPQQPGLYQPVPPAQYQQPPAVQYPQQPPGQYQQPPAVQYPQQPPGQYQQPPPVQYPQQQGQYQQPPPQYAQQPPGQYQQAPPAQYPLQVPVQQPPIALPAPIQAPIPAPVALQQPPLPSPYAPPLQSLYQPYPAQTLQPSLATQPPVSYESPYYQATNAGVESYQRAQLVSPPQAVESPGGSNYPTSQYGNFGVPLPKDESEASKPKTPLADPKIFLPPPIHKARGQSTPSLTTEVSKKEPSSSGGSPKASRPSLPARGSSALGSGDTSEVSGGEEGEETGAEDALPKKNWMDASKVGPPPPRPFGSKATTAPPPLPPRSKSTSLQSLNVAPPLLPSRSSTNSEAASTVERDGDDVQEPETPKKNWMDVSGVGPPPPKVFRAPTEIKNPPKAPPRKPEMPSSKHVVERGPEVSNPPGIDFSKYGPPPKTYHPPLQTNTPPETPSAITTADTLKDSGEAAPKPKPFTIDTSKFGPPPRPHRKPSETTSAVLESQDDQESEPFSHITKKTSVELVELVELARPDGVPALKKPPAPLPVKKNPLLRNWAVAPSEAASKTVEEESIVESPVIENTPSKVHVPPKIPRKLSSFQDESAAVIPDNNDFVSSLRGNLKKTNADFSRFDGAKEAKTLSVESLEIPSKRKDSNSSEISIIRPKPMSMSSKKFSESSESVQEPATIGKIRGILLPGLSDLSLEDRKLSPLADVKTDHEPAFTKKKPAPPPTKPKPKAYIDEDEKLPALPSKPRPTVTPTEEKKNPAPQLPKPRAAASADRQQPPPLGARPRMATPPVAPPSRSSYRRQAPELNLLVEEGWWASDDITELPQDLRGLNYSTSFGYSTSEKFRIFAFRLRDLSTLKLRFTWSRSSTDPLKSYNFDQKFIPAPQPTTLKQITTPHEKYGEYIASWCENKEGSTVGSGECWDLAHDALQKGCGKHAFVSDGLNHGYLMLTVEGDPAGARLIPSSITDDIKRGDILQFKSCIFKYSNSVVSYGAPDHTAVVLENKLNNFLEIIHQNVNGVKKVQRGELDLDKLAEGEIKVFRPMDSDWIGELNASWP